LRKSGIKKNIGNNLKLHPTVKITAIMNEDVDAIKSTVPLFQVFEFSPDIVIGGSVFSLPYAATGLSDCWEDAQDKMPLWNKMVTYYALVRSSGKGIVRAATFPEDAAFAYYKITEKDKRQLSIGLARLGQLFFAAGAKVLYPTIAGHPPFKKVDECLKYLDQDIPIHKTSLLTIHIFSSCPMGEKKDLSAANSFGKIWNYDNLYINDASLFIDALGVNPQGTIMAIALRNVNHYLSSRMR
ncbi:GMC family oxidoreductase, partial [bacterium]|nr:GMC family oxidoreductase [bacterium]